MPHSPWVTSQQVQPKSRLFCFPYAGGSATIYRQWPQALPAEVEVCPIHLPGREARLLEQPFAQIEALIPLLSQMLEPYLHVPFQFFGHSMGALLSFELARQLRRQHLPEPTRLFVSAHRAPQLPRHGKIIHTLPKQQFIESIKDIGGTPDAILQNTELMELILPTLQADFTLCETYQYRPEAPLDIPIHAFGGLEDRDVDTSMLEGWQAQTNQSFKLQMFPGGHFYIHQQQATLLRTLAAYYN